MWGASPLVASWVPTPKESMGAPLATRSRMRYSSRSPLTMILAPGWPASSRMPRTWRVSAPKSPLSRRTPHIGPPRAAARRGASRGAGGGVRGAGGGEGGARAGERAEIAAVQADSPHRAAESGGAAGAFQRVVGVDQVDGGRAEDALEFAEGVGLAGEGHDPGMGGGAHHRDAVAEIGA